MTKFETLRELIADHFEVDADTVLLTTRFVRDLGADSLDLVELSMSIEDEFNIEISTERLELYPTVNDIFKAINKPMNTLNIGQAIEALKQGKRVCREGWNGKGMFLFLLPASDGIPTKVIHDPALRAVIESEIGGETFDALGSIRMFTADKKILTGWLASQTDLLAEDWQILD